MTVSRVNEQCEQRVPRMKECGSSSAKRCRRTPKLEDTGSGAIDNGTRRYNGDGLVIRMRSNHRALEITGDGCRIVLSKNSGSIRVVGDGCRLSVGHNVGDIEYTGDGGRIFLGPNSSTERVKYVGDAGKVAFNSSLGDSTIEIRSEGYRTTEDPRKSPGESLTNRSNEESDRVPRAACSCERVIERILLKHKIQHEGQDVVVDGNARISSNLEYLDNAVNDAKERRQGKCAKPNEEIGKHSPHRIVATKIITKIQADGRCKEEWCGDSTALILNSTNGNLAMSCDKNASNIVK